MIRQEFHAYCDNCSEKFVLSIREGVVWFPDESCLHQQLLDDVWYVENDKHYCPECFLGYYDNDEIMLKQVTET